MTPPNGTTRRGFLKSASALTAAPGVWNIGEAVRADSGAALLDPLDPAEIAPEDRLVLRSQPLPEPRIVLPTDALGSPSGPKKRIAAITTAYFKYSHADDIITKFIEGYAVVGRTHLPHCDVVSLYVEQFPDSDIGRGMAARYSIPLFDTPAAALCLGGKELAVDGVLLIGEHGDYPSNAKGQKLYPRRRLFQEIVGVFRSSDRSVPVYNDKHFSYSWRNTEWMYSQSQKLDFAMMAGSSVPVTWRRPPLAFRPGIELEGALGVGFGGAESYGFHTLELLQTFAERRRDGETGVRAVQALEGPAVWQAAKEGRWQQKLLRAAMARVPGTAPPDAARLNLRQADPNAIVYLIEYSDGFQAAAYLSRGMISEFAFAAAVRGRSKPVSTWCPLLKPQRDHFSFLCNHIEVMFRTGKPSYPVERTYLVTGMLAALMDSRFEAGRQVETPQLSEIRYTPAPELTVA